MRFPPAPFLLILALLVPAVATLTPTAAPGQSGADLTAPLSETGFAARVTGHTFFYTQDGQPFGAEQYLPDHRVVWAFVGNDCQYGRWYEKAGQICFAYEDEPDAQCWTFFDRPGGLTAYYLGDQATAPLIAAQQSPEPMACMGPDVGV